MPNPHAYLIVQRLNAAGSGLALEDGGHLASIDGKMPALGPAIAALSMPITYYDYTTPVEVAAGGGVFDVTTIAAGGPGSSFWNLLAEAVYELRADPNWTAGQVDTDVIRGVYRLGGAPANDDNGNYIRTGERARICVAVPTTVYVRAHNLDVQGRWKLFRKDA